MDSSVTDYLDRRKRAGHNIRLPEDEVRDRCRTYLIEEIAENALLAELGHPVEIYPGPELPCLELLASHHFEGCPASLRTRTNVELRLRKGDTMTAVTIEEKPAD